MSINSHIKHIIRTTIIILLTGYFGLIAILNIPFIQQQISDVATQELRKILKTEVHIGNIDLGLLNRIIIQDVHLNDRSGHELIKISRLSAKFDIPSLLHGQIRIHSAQLFGLQAHISRPDTASPANLQFVLDAFASKDTLSPKKVIDLRINSVLIRRGEVNYDVWSEKETPAQFNPHHLSVQNLSATLSLKALTADSLNMQVKRLSFSEKSGFKVRRLTLKVTGNRKAFHVNQVELGLPESSIAIDTLSATYGSLTQLASFQEHTRYLGEIRASITPRDLQAFVPALAHFKDALNFSLSARGKGGRLECSQIRLYNNEKTLSLEAQAMCNHLGQKDDLFLFGKISELRVSQRGCEWLFHNLTGKAQAPGIVQRLGSIHFTGDVSGIPHQLTTQGTLATQVGTVTANVTMYTDTLTQRHSYSGKIFSDRLSLGRLLDQQKAFGNTAFNLELKGFRYHNGKAESYIKGEISSLVYNQYEYKNIALDGHYQPGGFNGKISLNDPNGNIEVEGSFATLQQVPDFNLRAYVRNLKPHTLHLTPKKFKDTDFSVDVIADFTGNSIDDMKGRISVERLKVESPQEEENFFMEQLLVTARNLQEDSLSTGGTAGAKQITLQAPFVHGEVTGNYSYRTITASILKMIQRYIPALLNRQKGWPDTQNDFRFRLKLEDSPIYRQLLGIPLTLHMPATISGYVSDPQNRLQLRGYLPEFIYNEGYYESGALLCDNLSDELKCQVRVNKRLKKGAMLNLAAHARVKDNTLHTTLDWGNNTTATFSGKLETTTQFSVPEETGKIATDIRIHPSEVILNEVPWRVHPADIALRDGRVHIHNFLFEHEDQFVKANGSIGPEEADSCLVDLKHINLRYVMDIIQFHAVDFDGLVSGKACLRHLTQDPDIQTLLHVDGFSLNQALLGQAAITGQWDKELGGIRLKADIRENDSYYTRVDGYISPKMKGLDLHIDAGGTNLAFLHKFVDNTFPDIQGRAFGNVRLYGPFSQLDLEGNTRAHAKVKVGVLNTYMNAQTDSVIIRSGHFQFKQVTLSDEEGHRGTAEGELNHTKLKNLSYRFRFNTQNMLVFLSEKETPDFPFYGKIYTSGNVLLRGGNNALHVDGQLRTDPKTSFTYVTTTAAEATSNQFITFVDRTPRRKQEEVDTEVYHYLNQPKEQKEEHEVESDIHLNLQIEATPAATMRIIMDPMAGDNISARGNGNLQMNFYNKGDFQMFGNYLIDEGVYKMSLQNVIRKDFILQPGGIVSFNGNPKRANLNVQAVYTVNSASLNDLIPDASANKGTVRVNCLLNLSGNLTAPALHFDLELPTVSDEDRELVRSLTNTEEQMNTQIIYLLTIGKFYTYDYANNANQSDATSSLAFSTLSGQLNNMLSQVIDNQNWNLGTNLSTGEKGWGDVEAEAILSGRLLNNRLIINGNFGYRDNPMRNTNFVGDFEAMWLLTKNGEFRLKGYNQTNDRYFTKSTLTTQGIGLMYKKDFTHWRELIDWMLLKNRRNRRRAEKEEKKQQKALPADTLRTAVKKEQEERNETE